MKHLSRQVSQRQHSDYLQGIRRRKAENIELSNNFLKKPSTKEKFVQDDLKAQAEFLIRSVDSLICSGNDDGQFKLSQNISNIGNNKINTNNNL